MLKAVELGTLLVASTSTDVNTIVPQRPTHPISLISFLDIVTKCHFASSFLFALWNQAISQNRFGGNTVIISHWQDQLVAMDVGGDIHTIVITDPALKFYILAETVSLDEALTWYILGVPPTSVNLFTFWIHALIPKGPDTGAASAGPSARGAQDHGPALWAPCGQITSHRRLD